ncbi:MAG: PDZ domain-containing protein [Gemmatimonadaceae bacterium]
MTRLLLLAAAASVALPLASSAQDVRIFTSPQRRALVELAADRPMIGVTTATASERADTLGLLIEDVREDSPAAKAGLKAGDRLQSVNGVSLRADRTDAGENDYDGVLNRRLTREVQKTTEGGTIELRVLSGTQSRAVRVTPVKASELMGRVSGYSWSTMDADRAVIGLTIGSSGSARDTLGVFVSSVTTDGPAEKAGIVEGDRIAAINGVSVRVAREDATDPAVGGAKANRLRREIAKLKAGDTAELTVVSAGRTRTVRVTAVKASDLPGSDWSGFLQPLEEFRLRMAEPPMPARPMVAPRPPAAPRAPVVTRGRVVSI